MANTYSWEIDALDCYPQQDDKTDVVFNIHYRHLASDGVYSGSIYGAQKVILNPSEPFTPFADLTKDQVLNWLLAAMGETFIADQEETLDQQIAAQANPPVVTPPLPWGTPSA